VISWAGVLAIQAGGIHQPSTALAAASSGCAGTGRSGGLQLGPVTPVAGDGGSGPDPPVLERTRSDTGWRSETELVGTAPAGSEHCSRFKRRTESRVGRSAQTNSWDLADGRPLLQSPGGG